MHCMNHRLNLCVADTCQLPLVRNMMSVVRNLSEFFNNSPNQQQHFDQHRHRINASCLPLIDVCRTRWIECIDGMDRIVELLHPVLTTLEDTPKPLLEGAHDTGNRSYRIRKQVIQKSWIHPCEEGSTAETSVNINQT